MKIINRPCELDPNRTKYTQYTREEIDQLAAACNVNLRRPTDGRYKRKSELFDEIMAAANAAPGIKRPVRITPIKPLPGKAQPPAAGPRTPLAQKPTPAAEEAPVAKEANCSVKKTCPSGYRKKELELIATRCGISLKRPGGTKKNAHELCQEILEIMNKVAKAAPAAAVAQVELPVPATREEFIQMAERIEGQIKATYELEKEFGKSTNVSKLFDMYNRLHDIIVPVKAANQVDADMLGGLHVFVMNIINQYQQLLANITDSPARRRFPTVKAELDNAKKAVADYINQFNRKIRNEFGYRTPPNLIRTFNQKINVIKDKLDKIVLNLESVDKLDRQAEEIKMHLENLRQLERSEQTEIKPFLDSYVSIKQGRRNLLQRIETLRRQEREDMGRDSPFYIRYGEVYSEVENRNLGNDMKSLTETAQYLNEKGAQVGQIEQAARDAAPLRGLIRETKNLKQTTLNNIGEVYRTERNAYGDTDFSRRLRELHETVDSIAVPVESQDALENMQLLLNDFVAELANIGAEIRAAGRRCKNATSPIMMEDVEDIDNDIFIRFSNGACWDVESLIQYLRESVNGQNDATQIRRYTDGYPSDKIWENDNDYRKLVDHPKSRQNGLHNFIQSRRYADLANRISDATARQIYRSGSLLWSRGPPFEEAIREQMNQDQTAEWNAAKRNMSVWELPDRIAYPQTDIAREVYNIFNGVIKTQGITELDRMYQALSDDEKNALEELSPNIGSRIKSCRRGEYCVMQMGERLIKLYNTIAENKDSLEPLLNIPGLGRH